jgi:hypothetical protein
MPAELLSSYNFFKEQVEALNHSCEALDHLVNEYFITLTQGGYSELSNLRITLNAILETSSILLAQGDSEELSKVLDYALLGGNTPPSSLQNKISQDLNIYNWQARTQELLKKIETSLAGASSKYKKVGLTKKRERIATDSVLGEVRKALLAVAKKTP